MSAKPKLPIMRLLTWTFLIENKTVATSILLRQFSDFTTDMSFQHWR